MKRAEERRARELEDMSTDADCSEPCIAESDASEASHAVTGVARRCGEAQRGGVRAAEEAAQNLRRVGVERLPCGRGGVFEGDCGSVCLSVAAVHNGDLATFALTGSKPEKAPR